MLKNKTKLLILFFSFISFLSLNIATFYLIDPKTSLDISFYIFGGILIMVFLIWVGYIYKPKKTKQKNKKPTALQKIEIKRNGKDHSFEEHLNYEAEKGKGYFYTSLLIAIGNVLAFAVTGIIYFI